MVPGHPDGREGGRRPAGETFTLIEWSAPAGFGPPLHRHDREDECFYVLSGAIRVDCGDQQWEVGPGEFVFLPRQIPHGFVVTDGPVRGLQITTPAGFERFAIELGRPADRPGLPAPSVPDVPRLVEAGQRYGHQILGPPPDR